MSCSSTLSRSSRLATRPATERSSARHFAAWRSRTCSRASGHGVDGASNQTGVLLLTTGHESELSVGYCPLYGDTNGGLSLIGDLYQLEVFALSRYLNERAGRELIPTAILERRSRRRSLPPVSVRQIACLARSEFKRRQAAPILRLRPQPFGTGRQMPIAAHYGDT